ncbi:ectonucleotide pyrophosphatase/phosphodiesterase family member 5-like [Liolophura sinensis]|uniref:ectonucleotide pyrophosphatase/phosphodiesterase family member 5-like n=1 Tax=Liolophura sinensis TaxID=3198878 RepID=UPI0031593C3D
MWLGRRCAVSCWKQVVGICTWVVVVSRAVQAVSNHPLLLVILFDGFRWDYVDKFDTPNFHTLMQDGVRAVHVQNVMPTVTMANHYTILTGMYAESHGIVANNFYDPKLGEFHMADNADQTDPKWFNTGVEPIWVTNQLKSNERFSGSMLWPDSLAAVKGIAPTYQRGPPLFDTTVDNRTRIDTVISWFLKDDRPINLGLLYFEEPDEIGHEFGPNSEQMKDTVMALDGLIGYLIEQLKDKGLYEVMNILVTADHGMSEVLSNKSISLEPYVEGSLYQDYQLSSMGFLNPVQGKEEEVYRKLKKMEAEHGEVKVYRRSDALMTQLNYSSNDRISPLIITVDEGFYLIRAEYEKKYSTTGLHGYFPSVSNMHPFFIAHGPAFKKNYTTEVLSNIDFYELMCHVLELTPAPNNGSFQNVKHILVERESDATRATNYTLLTYFCVAVFCALVTGVCTIGAFRQRQMHSRVISLEDIRLLSVNNMNHEVKVPLLNEDDEMEEENFDL